MEREKYVDESWKDEVAQEKERLNQQAKQSSSQGPSTDSSASGEGSAQAEETSFLNYISSLAFQALVFLGQIPNPMENNQKTVNLRQAKLLIDTLLMLRDKTKGNLTAQEEDFLNTSLYELQMQFLEAQKADVSALNPEPPSSLQP